MLEELEKSEIMHTQPCSRDYPGHEYRHLEDANPKAMIELELANNKVMELKRLIAEDMNRRMKKETPTPPDGGG